MASPQLENGFTRVANEILTVTAATRFSAAQLAIVMCVWRYTYGFNRKAHEMSESFLAGATGISIRHIKRELSVLLKSKVLISIRDPTIRSARVLAFNKDYSQWQICPRVPDLSPGDGADTTPGDVFVTAPDDVFVTAPGDGLVTQERNLKENIKTVMCRTDFIECNKPFGV
ncbi:MAG: replication protein [Eubacteriales bacterium]|nr:replication protein [Eubacteriales bacterium]